MKAFKKLSLNAVEAIKGAYKYAQKSGSEYVELKHLFLAIINQKETLVSKAFESVNFKSSVSFQNFIDISGEEVDFIDKVILLSVDFERALSNAYHIAHSFHHVYVGTEHLLLGLLQIRENSFVKELSKFAIDYDYAYNLLVNYGNYPPGIFYQNSNVVKSLENKPSVIANLAINLNEVVKLSKNQSAFVGRDKEINRIIQILSRRDKNNPILIGEAGVGKTALVKQLAYRIVSKNVPENLLDFEIWSLDISKLMISTEMRGELETKINSLLEEIKQRGNVILFIDEVHMIFNTGGNFSSNDIANMLKPHLVSEYFRCIGATTFYEYQRYFENDNALNRRFLPVKVNELSKEDTLEVIKSVKLEIEKYHKVKISDDSIVDAVNLSDRFIVDRFFPDKAIDLIEEAATLKNIESNKYSKSLLNMQSELQRVIRKKESYLSNQKYLQSLYFRNKERFLISKIKDINEVALSDMRIVDRKDLINVVSTWTDIPVFNILNNGLRDISKIKKEIRSEIIGQDNAVSRVMDIMMSARVGLRDENRPIGIFLFIGPTGVGKTELAKQIATKYMGGKKSLIQIDMSEYMESHSVSKFIGSPPGYVGYQEGGKLSESVKNHPYSVILFDEIEKAHPDVLNILLQIMEEGHLTDSRGKFVNFKNTIIILTSNIGSEIIESNSVLGFNIESYNSTKTQINEEYEKVEEKTLSRLKEYLLPEFLNRIDDVIIFRSLNKSDAFKIAKKLAIDFSKKSEKIGLYVSFTDSFISFIAEKGFSEEFGARQIKRVFNKYAETSLSTYLIENKIFSSQVYKSKLSLTLSIDSLEKIEVIAN